MVQIFHIVEHKAENHVDTVIESGYDTEPLCSEREAGIGFEINGFEGYDQSYYKHGRVIKVPKDVHVFEKEAENSLDEGY